MKLIKLTIKMPPIIFRTYTTTMLAHIVFTSPIMDCGGLSFTCSDSGYIIVKVQL